MAKISKKERLRRREERRVAQEVEQLQEKERLETEAAARRAEEEKRREDGVAKDRAELGTLRRERTELVLGQDRLTEVAEQLAAELDLKNRRLVTIVDSLVNERCMLLDRLTRVDQRLEAADSQMLPQSYQLFGKLDPSQVNSHVARVEAVTSQIENNVARARNDGRFATKAEFFGGK